MVSRDAALAIASRFLRERVAPYAPHAVIVEDGVRETNDAWVVPYEDERSLGGDPDHSLAGNLPILVSKHDGAVDFDRP
jgi:hypothetical protein